MTSLPGVRPSTPRLVTGPDRDGRPTSLYEHALRLHAQDPDRPLPRGGRPLPDGERHGPMPRTSPDPRISGLDVAVVLDSHFGRPGAHASELVDAFQGLDVPLDPTHHVAAAALRADRDRVRQTGRWLVRNSTDRDAVAVGLALLASDRDEDDVPLIRTIGLLSDHFGALAADALRRRAGGGDALLWLTQRVAGWGRVDVVEALCERGLSPAARAWLLRHGCDGHFFNGYFAGRLATTAHLHEAITGSDVDDALVDHTGRLLGIMAGCAGVGMTLASYPPAPVVLAAHVAHLARQAPSVHRYVDAAVIADHLAEEQPTRGGDFAPYEQRTALVRDYLAVLVRPEWRATVRPGLDPDVLAWFVQGVATRLSLDVLGDLEGQGEG